MPSSTGSRLFRFLLSLVTRLRWSLGRVALTLQARLALLWRSILAFARRSGQSQVRLLANNVPVVDDTPGERPRLSEVEEEASGTLAALPVRRPARWQDELPIYQALTSGRAFSYDPTPAIPEVVSQRYTRRKVIGESPKSLDIPAGQDTLLHALRSPPDGWIRHIHPEGSVLFYHEGLRLFTESNIIRHEREIIFHATTLIQQAIQTDGVTMDELTEIVLNVDDDQRWYYYFVDHTNRLLFWVHRINSSWDLDVNLERVSGYSHIKYSVEARYWYASSKSVSGICVVYDMNTRSHCEFYPHNRVLPKGVFEELRGMLNYARMDMVTSDVSTSAFALDELLAISDLVSSLTGDKNGKISDSCSIWIIARLMSSFTDNQFINFYGQQYARLDADTPLFGQETWNRSNVFKVANVFLFGSLNDHAARLQRVWVDDIVFQSRWKSFINRLTNELSRYTLLSTVMLTVNFGFLAVPGVVAIDPRGPASPIVIIIYCSVLSTVGSILFSVVLMNLYSDTGTLGVYATTAVLKTLSRKKWGMTRFAIIHSLPYACLIWSIIFFAVALAILIFSPKELPTVVTLGIECLILVSFGIVTMRVMWLFPRNEADSADTFAESVTESQSDIEQGGANR